MIPTTLVPKGRVPESWRCVDCGFDTAPGCLNRVEMEIAARALGNRWYNGEGVPQYYTEDTEVYCVRSHIWAAAKMEPYGGCLCIGCLEKRIGRKLRPRDFQRDHPFNLLPACGFRSKPPVIPE
jgi:hypothetical protein